MSSDKTLFSGHHLSRVVAGRKLFAALSFELAAGDTLAVSGPSGSGKTSLLRALAWLDPLQGGGLALSGKSPTEIGIAQFRRQVCLVPQHPPAWRGTSLELLAAIAALTAQRVSESDSATQIADAWGLPSPKRSCGDSASTSASRMAWCW
jgi:ABC-type iron transport system FetAB ATPase subunit